ncbi:MAG: tetratricopeptide repeat protein [Pseudomonadota bacterium]
MNKALLIVCVLIVNLLIVTQYSKAQSYGNKDFYMIDSLVLEELTPFEQNLIDSCMELYHAAQHDTGRIAAISGILSNMMHVDWVSYVYLQNEIIDNALANRPSSKVKISLLKSKATALNNIGYINKVRGNIVSAMDYYQQCLKLDKEMGNNEGIAVALTNIGSIYYNQGDIVKGLEYFEKSLEIRLKLGDKWGISNSLNNIGFVHDEQGNDTKALEYYNRSLKIDEELGYYSEVATDLNNIGAVYNDMGNDVLALEYYKRSLKINEEIGNRIGIADELNNIGVIYQARGDLSFALDYYEQGLLIFEKIEDKVGITNSLFKIGMLALLTGNVSKAKEYGERSLILSKELRFPYDIKNATMLLSKVYENEGNGMQALHMYKTYITMRDSLNNEAVKEEFVRQEVKYEFEKAEIIRKQKEKEELRILKEKIARKRNLQYSGISIVLFILFGILFILGKFNLPGWAIQVSIFLPLLLLFEFLLIFIGPFIDLFTGGEPAYNLLVNASVAALIAPLHSFFEVLFKRRLVKTVN